MALWHDEMKVTIPVQGDELEITFSHNRVMVEYIMTLTNESNWKRFFDTSRFAELVHEQGDPACWDCGCRIRPSVALSAASVLCAACTDLAIRRKESNELLFGSDQEREEA